MDNNKFYKWRTMARNPIDEDTKAPLKVKSHGIEFRNVGEVEAKINNFWDLKPHGEPKFFGYDNLDFILEDEFEITFKKGVTGVKCVQIAEIVVKNFDYNDI